MTKQDVRIENIEDIIKEKEAAFEEHKNYYFEDSQALTSEMYSLDFFKENANLNFEELETKVYNWYSYLGGYKQPSSASKQLIRLYFLKIYGKHSSDPSSLNIQTFIDSITININNCFFGVRFIGRLNMYGRHKELPKIKNFGKEELSNPPLDGQDEPKGIPYKDFRHPESVKINITLKNISRDRFEEIESDSKDRSELKKAIASIFCLRNSEIELNIKERDRSEKFQEMKEKKVENAQKALDAVSRLANKRLYEWTNDDYINIKKDLLSSLAKVIDEFDDNKDLNKNKIRFLSDNGMSEDDVVEEEYDDLPF